MKDYCRHQLLVVGPSRNLKKFDWTVDWPAATDLELLEHSPERLVWQFITDEPALAFLRGLSRRWSRLTLILNYDCEDHRLAGLVRAKNGRLRHHQVRY